MPIPLANRRALPLMLGSTFAVLLVMLVLAAGESSAAPFEQQGPRFTSAEAASEDKFGSAVALSEDGDTAVVGAPKHGGGAGAAWVFTRSGGVWTQQGGELTGGGEVGEALFGSSVAISGDGETVAIGGPHDNGEVGAAWVFRRSGSTWAQQGAKLTPKKEVGDARFGASVALSSDGATALIGGPLNKAENGAAWVFEPARNGVWKQRKALSAKGGKALFGTSVALTGDGDTALVGAPGDSERYGAAWVFRRAGKGWTHPGEKLVGSPGEVHGYGPVTGRGAAVTLSRDGTTALIAGYGAAWVFVSSGTTFEQQGPVIEDSQTFPFPPGFGTSVALSANGDEALIGAPFAGEFNGEVRVLERSGSTWSLVEELNAGHCPTEFPCSRRFGEASALSSDGNTALIGGPAELTGFAWAFVR